jgi:hypothetical protein
VENGSDDTATYGEDEDCDDGETVAKSKKFTFTLKGDFGDEWKAVGSRAYLADGKDLTDVWVLDYVGGELVQQIHQDDNTAEDFGKPVLQLTYGEHHVYFVASRGTTPTLNTTAGTITWAKPSDTFYKDYEVNVVATSNGNRAVTLDRVATKLKLTITDEIPATCAEVGVTPATWYYGWNYVDGTPTASQQTERMVAVPANVIGTSGELVVTIFGLSSADEWTTNVIVSGKTSAHAVIGTATITDAPFRANRSTEYSGPLFGAGGVATMSLSSEWLDSHIGTW